MSDENSRRTGRAGGIFVALVIGGSAVGVIGWYVNANRTGPTIDASGFDLSAAPQSHHAAAAAAPAPDRPASSLALMKGEAGVRIADSNQSSSGRAPAKQFDGRERAHADFTELARKHEADVRRFVDKMAQKHPVLNQFSRDWMSRPDLKKLHDDYFRSHDPGAFIKGLAKAPSLGGLVATYSGSPAIIDFITQGLKEAPGELTSAAMSVLSTDSVAKNVISNVATGVGLPPSITGLINGGGDAKVDQKQVMSDMMNSPAVQNAMPQAGQQPPPVSLSNQR